jgi:pimeloyl-ACP methyl ester carboxylesterase
VLDVDETIAWRQAGPASGQHVALLHGLGGSRVAWDPQLEALAAAGYRVAAWDMPGYGASAAIEPLTFEALVDSVGRWLDALGAESAHVVGLSLGGMLAQHVALRMAGRVRSLALLDTSPAFGFDGSVDAQTWIESRLAPIRSGATPASMAYGVLGPIMAPGAAGLAEAVAAMARIDPDAFEGAVRCLPSHDVHDRLAEIAAPTLVIVGELDLETPPSYARHLAGGIRDSRYVEIAGAGHISNLEQPAQFNAALVDFLAGRGSSTSD